LNLKKREQTAQRLYCTPGKKELHSSHFVLPSTRFTPSQTNHTNILLTIMFPRNEIFQAIPFDASSDITEPLIVVGDADEGDYGLRRKGPFLLEVPFSALGIACGFLKAVFHPGSSGHYHVG
jgi:hypothetical protein